MKTRIERNLLHKKLPLVVRKNYQ